MWRHSHDSLPGKQGPLPADPNLTVSPLPSTCFMLQPRLLELSSFLKHLPLPHTSEPCLCFLSPPSAILSPPGKFIPCLGPEQMCPPLWSFIWAHWEGSYSPPTKFTFICMILSLHDSFIILFAWFSHLHNFFHKFTFICMSLSWFCLPCLHDNLYEIRNESLNSLGSLPQPLYLQYAACYFQEVLKWMNECSQRTQYNL